MLEAVDPHVHLRGKEYKNITFAAYAFIDAVAAGVASLIEMPNPKPPLTDEAGLTQRFADMGGLVNTIRELDNYLDCWRHVGITNDPQQITGKFLHR